MTDRILVVEDEAIVAEVVERFLRREGYDTMVVCDGKQALSAVKRFLPDLIVLDLMLPEIDGLEVCRQVRSHSETPIIMLTARGEETDKVLGLGLGADDYVTKPFSPRELIARVRAVMRRVRPALADEQLRLADLEMDVVRHKVKRGGRSIPLGPTEFRLLKHFLEHPARVFSRERLLDAVWGRDKDIEVRTVDVHIRRLRQALNVEGRPELIRTVRSAGYALDDDAV